MPRKKAAAVWGTAEAGSRTRTNVGGYPGIPVVVKGEVGVGGEGFIGKKSNGGDLVEAGSESDDVEIRIAGMVNESCDAAANGRVDCGAKGPSRPRVFDERQGVTASSVRDDDASVITNPCPLGEGREGLEAPTEIPAPRDGETRNVDVPTANVIASGHRPRSVQKAFREQRSFDSDSEVTAASGNVLADPREA